MGLSNKFNGLFDKDFHIARKRKIIFAVPLAVLAVAVIMMIVFRFTLGSAINLGTDFTGGYSVDIKLGNKLTDANKQEYYNQITDVLGAVTDANGKTYKVVVSGAMQMQGSGDTASIRVKYSQILGVSENEMSEFVNPAIIDALEERVLNKVPSVTISGKIITATYDEVINNHGTGSPFDDIKKAFLGIVESLNSKHSANINVDANSFALGATNNKQIVITSSSEIASSQALVSAIVKGLNVPDKYSGSVTGGDMVGATVSVELIFNAVLAVVLALIFMLVYIGFRFQLSSGIACILALLHDVLIMFLFMAICHVEINSTFIAALITILGYSINNSIIVFDRVRENMQSIYVKTKTPEDVADKSVKETLLRSINTTITTVIMILMVAIIGVTDIRIFAFPILVGLLAGTYSSIFIAPSLWALFQRVGNGNRAYFNLPPINKKVKKEKSVTREMGA